jgi:hypothetical protein
MEMVVTMKINPVIWWTAGPWLGSMLLLSVAIFALLSWLPDNKWDRAVALKVCGRFVILRQEDGSVWLRINGFRTYRIDGDWQKVCL